MDLYDELTLVIRTFTENDLEYAICGGIAVAFHGYERFTRDIDVLIRANDIDKAHKILEAVGYLDPSGRIPFEHHDLYRINKVEGTDYLSLDLLVVNDKLDEVWNDRQTYDWQESKIVVVSKEGLATMKRMAGRDQDVLDLKQLGINDDEAGDTI